MTRARHVLDRLVTVLVLVMFDVFARALNHNPAHPGGAL